MMQGCRARGIAGIVSRGMVWLLLILGLVPFLHGQQAKAQLRQARLHVALAAGVYQGSGGFPDVASRNLAGLQLESENIWPGSRYSFLMIGQAHFDSETSVLAEMLVALGGAFYLREPVRPEVQTGQEFLLSQQQIWNVRLAAFGGLGRKLLRPFEVGELEANTDIVVVGTSALLIFPVTQTWSLVLGPGGHSSIGVGRYDSFGQSLMFRLGFEVGL